MSRLWLRGRLVTPERVVDDGLLEIVDERIAGVWDLGSASVPATSPGPAPASAAATSPGPAPASAAATSPAPAPAPAPGPAGGNAPAFPYRHLLPAAAGEEGELTLPDGSRVTYRHEATGWLVPGFVDLHVHGGFDGDFSVGDPAAAERACAGHLRHGTTALLATTVTLSPGETLAALQAARATRFWAGEWKQTGRLEHGGRGAGLAPEPRHAPVPVPGTGGGAGARIVGFHVEGPFINPARKGAQDPGQIRTPDLDEFERWYALAPGCGWVITLAPEREGALPFIAAAAARGVVVSVGHTDASFDQVKAALAAGARSVTHLFNAMSPLHHREPGTVGAALALPLNVEMIADGHHVHLAVLGAVARLKGPDQAVLITDAIRATGMPDGDYALGALPITVRDGVARLTQGGSLAGSTLTMDRAVANLVQQGGIDLPLAVRMASLNPARLIGLDHLLGSLSPGRLADVVVLGPDLLARRVYLAGREVV